VDSIEAGVALATLALALVTGWMAREIRKERIDTAKEKVRGALRSALMEQLENARRWHTAKPDRKGYDPDEYRFAEPVMEQLNTLARDVDLPSDLAGYLIWLVAHVRRTWAEYAAMLDKADETDQKILDRVEVRRVWGLGLDDVQVLAGLVACELTRRGHAADAAVIQSVPWMLPEKWGEGRTSTMITFVTYMGAPRFPASPFFAPQSPGSRDKRAAEVSAATAEHLRASEEAIHRAGF
jgi:hypothetical protein